MNQSSQSYKVLFITHTVRMGGANHSMLQLILELRDNYNVHPIVLMPHIPIDAKKWNLSMLCELHSIEWYSYKFHWFQGRNWILTSIGYIENLYNYLKIYLKVKKINFDAIHTNSSVIDLGAFLSCLLKKPHIWHLREYGDLDFSFYPVFGRIHQKFVYRYGDVFIAISNSIKQHFMKYIPEYKIKMIYNGVSPDRIKEISSHDHNVTNFCVLGRVSEEKNQYEALKALDILVNNYKTKSLHIYFVGSLDKKYVEVMQNFIKNKCLGEFVTFVGELKEVSDLMKEMDVGLMLSKNEAFGRVTVEYQMYNLAVIASNAGANSEIVDDKINGIIYQLGNINQLAEIMMKLSEDRDYLIGLAQKGRDKALRMFLSSNNSLAVYELYKNIIK